jgi:membrane protein required for colicin V production
MNVLDLILILPILWGAYNGYKKGLLIEVIGVAAFIVALIVGFKMLGFGMNFIAPYIGEHLANRFMPYLSFSLIFFPTIFLINRFGWMLRKALRYTVLGTIDGFAGGVVGVFTWVFGLSTLLWLLSSIGYDIPKKYTENAIVYPQLKPIAPKIISKLSDLIPVGGNIIDEIKKKI